MSDLAMTMLIFDTLKFVERLTGAGIPEGHAKAEAMALQDALAEAFQHRWPSKHEADQARITLASSDRNVEQSVIRIKRKLTTQTWLLCVLVICVWSLVLKAFF